MDDLSPTSTDENAPPQAPEKPPVHEGTLAQYVEGVTDSNPLNIDLTVDDNTSKVILFHDKPFTQRINHFEYTPHTSEFFFIMQDDVRVFIGHPLSPSMSRYMQNTHQILTIEMNDETGEANRGEYIPVLLQS